MEGTGCNHLRQGGEIPRAEHKLLPVEFALHGKCELRVRTVDAGVSESVLRFLIQIHCCVTKSCWMLRSRNSSPVEKIGIIRFFLRIRPSANQVLNRAWITRN